eukprot:12137650-Karenia_brevis.AAC.1
MPAESFVPRVKSAQPKDARAVDIAVTETDVIPLADLPYESEKSGTHNAALQLYNNLACTFQEHMSRWSHS